MRCLHCDYSLWNLKARQCPECGAPFTPRDYEFVPNAVRFCCPHCEQPYYGTGPTGLLEPDAFDCVQCGRAVTLDEMVLLPAEGVRDHQTKPGSNPWLERDRTGRLKSWWATVVQALVSPNRLAQGTPESSSLGQAWGFAIITWVITFVVSMIPAMCLGLGLPLLVPQTQQGGAHPMGILTAIMAGGVAFGIVAGFVFMIIYAWMWGLVTHALLRVSGPGVGPLRVTMQSILYTSGTFVISIIPCVGNMAAVWWIISAVISVKEAHEIGGVRATFAVLTGPVVLMVLFIGSYMVIIAVAFAGMGAAANVGTPALNTLSTQPVLNAIMDYAAVNGDRGPAHALELVMEPGFIESDFVDPFTMTVPVEIPVAGINLESLSLMVPDERPAVIDQAAAALPVNVVAHRVGDFVFTYHGVVLDGRAPDLWVVLMSPDSESNGPPGVVVAGRADGVLVRIPIGSFAFRLAQQNALRAGHGLPPLPDPSDVTHRAPAAAAPDER